LSISKYKTNRVGCYVSDTGKRLISQIGMVKAIAEKKRSGLADYIGINPLKPLSGR